MKLNREFSFYLKIYFITSNTNWAESNTDYVDLFIRTTGDHGQLDPAATVPFGMIKLVPDTEPGNHSGYNYNSENIKGFSHNRIGGLVYLIKNGLNKIG